MQSTSRSVPTARRASRVLPTVLLVLCVPCMATMAGAQAASTAHIVAQFGDPFDTGQLDPYDDYPWPGAFDDEGNVYTTVRNIGGNYEYAVARLGDDGLAALVKGCNSYGTECHATPVGGGFAHFYWTLGAYRPQVNDAGDVLFRAWVFEGSAFDGWFIRRASGALEKVVAFGDTNPLGGVYNNLRGAAIGDNGDVVFVGTSNGYTNPEAGVFLWRAGAITTILHHGQASPSGGTYDMLLMANVVPTVDPQGNAAFVGLASGGPHHLVYFDGVGIQAWMPHDAPTPFGGKWGTSPDGVLFNDCGEMIVATDVVYPGPSSILSNVVRRGGTWELLVDTTMELPDGTQIDGVGLPREPYSSFDDNGNVLMNAWITRPGQSLQGALMLVRVDGTMEIVGDDDDASPDGGRFIAGFFPAFGLTPSLNDEGDAHFAANTTEGEILARIDGLVPPVGAWVDLGLGLAGAAGAPALGGSGLLEAGGSTGLSLSGAAPSAPAMLFLGFSVAKQPFKAGVLVPALDLPPIPLATGPDGSLALGPAPVPASLPPCLTLVAQVWVQDAGAPAGAAASNAVKAVSR